MWVRGSRRDYDRWAANGAEGWSYAEVLPYFVSVMSWSKIETVHNSLHISLDYNTKAKISLKFMYFGPIYIVID